MSVRLKSSDLSELVLYKIILTYTQGMLVCFIHLLMCYVKCVIVKPYDLESQAQTQEWLFNISEWLMFEFESVGKTNKQNTSIK